MDRPWKLPRTVKVFRLALIVHFFGNMIYMAVAFHSSVVSSFDAATRMNRTSPGARVLPCLFSHLGSSRTKGKLHRFNNETFVYSDDCFGLIALSTGIAAKDAIFSGTFVALSALAAILGATVLSNTWTTAVEKKVPASVAGITLLVAPGIRHILISTEMVDFPRSPDWAPSFEVGVCIFSLLYGFVISPYEQADK